MPALPILLVRRGSCSHLLLSFVCTVLLAASLQAQRVVVSQELNVSEDERYELFAGSGDQVVVYRDNPNGVQLSAYNEKLEEVWSRDLTLDKPRPAPLGALMSRGQVVVFYTYRRDRSLYLKMHRYSDAGNLTDSLSVVELKDEFLSTNYDLHYDEAGRYALFTHQKDATTWLVLAVEVATGRLLYQHRIVLDTPVAASSEYANTPYVDARGGLYFWTQQENRRSRLEDHLIDLVRIDIDGQVQGSKIPLPETLVFDLELGVDEINNRVVFGGYYADNPDEAAGVMVLRLDYSLVGAAAELITSPFTPALIASVEPKDRRASGIANLDALNLIFRRDGGVLVIGEQRRATLRTVGGRAGYFGATMKTDYLYEDIILSVVGAKRAGKGDGDWHEVLPKKQFSQDDGAAFSGYFVAVTPRRMRLIYNDEVRSGGTVSEYMVDGTGDIARHSIMNTEYQNLWLRHEAGIQVSSTDIVIPSERRNRLRLVRLSYGG